MKNIVSRRSLISGLVALMVAPAQSLAHNWEKLGERSVRLVSDHDTIPVTVLRGDFRRIKLKVRGNGIFINEVVVNFAVGGADRLRVRSMIRAGGETRDLNLRGGERIIRSVHLIYRSVPNSKGRASVSVYGR